MLIILIVRCNTWGCCWGNIRYGCQSKEENQRSNLRYSHDYNISTVPGCQTWILGVNITQPCEANRSNIARFLGGVARSLNISYLKAVPIGATVRLSSYVIRVGKTMAMIHGKMASLDGLTIYCTVEHHKVNVLIKLEHRNARLLWDDGWERDIVRKEKK